MSALGQSPVDVVHEAGSHEELARLGSEILGGAVGSDDLLLDARACLADPIADPELQARWLYVLAWLGEWRDVAKAAQSTEPKVRRTAIELLSESLHPAYCHIPHGFVDDRDDGVRRAARTVQRLNGGPAATSTAPPAAR